jgi:uncharacterized protein (TIGR02599 family)
LVELLVAMAVLMLLLAIMAAVTQSTAQAVHQASGKLTTYASARAAFDIMNEKLAQATLNTYLDYYATNASGVGYLQTNVATFTPAIYGRVSNLQFITRENSNPQTPFNTIGNANYPCYGQDIYFQCPIAYSTSSSYLSTQGLLNACGYYVQYCNNTSFRPSMVTGSKWRYRLIQAIEPTESFQVYTYAISDSTTWTANIANTGPAAVPATDAIPLADNIIALVIWPQLPSAQESLTPLVTNYIYDSQLNAAPNVKSTPAQPVTAHQLPPILQVTMVVIDEASAARIDTNSSTPPAVIENALKGKFVATSNYAADLASVENSLSLNKIAYEVLNTAVVMRESKWSQ